MATITPTATQPDSKGAIVVTWANIGDSDTCTAWLDKGRSDRSFQVTGTFNSATVVAQVSNDGTNWVTASDPSGNAISMTSTGLKQITEISAQIRPSSSGGSSSNTTVRLVIH